MKAGPYSASISLLGIAVILIAIETGNSPALLFAGAAAFLRVIAGIQYARSNNG